MSKYGSAENFTPSDSTVSSFEMFMVTGTSGTVVIDQKGGNTLTLTGVPTNVWMPCGAAVRIKATGTTATGFIVV